MARQHLPTGFDHFNDVIYDIDNRFTIPKLKALCTALGLTVGGIKSELQGRLTTHLNLLLSQQDATRYNLAKQSAELQRGSTYGSRVNRSDGHHVSTVNTPASSAPAQTSAASNNWGMPSVYQNIRLPVYKRSSFYTHLTHITQAYTVNACPMRRVTQPIHLRLTSEMLSKLLPKQPSNPYRLVLFSTQTDRVALGNCLLEFPPDTDIRCNGSPVQANVRGITNRPGTINPPDLTAHVVMMQGVQNKIDVTFVDTKSSYTLTVYLVEKHTVAQLVAKIRKRLVIPKDAILRKVRAVAQDPDIVHGPETLSLRDPISMTRVTLPCKSRYCQHTACFDAATFLTLNEQTPTWTCPICNMSIPTDDDLLVDGYFNDILQSTSKTVQSVIIYPDGTWANEGIVTDHPDPKLLNTNTNNTNSSSRRSIKAEIVLLDDDDEDIGAPTPSSLHPATTTQSQKTSLPVRPSPSQALSRKRSLTQNADLTWNGDERSSNGRPSAKRNRG